MADLLDFEEPIGVLQKEIEALSMLPSTLDRQADIARLQGRILSIRGELYQSLTPWQRVLVARHPARPTTLDYVEQLFTDFVEIHGDRRFADDHAIIAGPAVFHGQPVHGRRAPEGQRHQAEDLPELRLRPARGLPQGAQGHAAGREVRSPDRVLRRHPGRLSGHRVGGARRRRGHRRQPARDGRARRADCRRGARRRAAAAARWASPWATVS